jgi:hypothetical protein
MDRSNSIKIFKQFLFGVIPAIVASCFIYLIFSIPEKHLNVDTLPGRPLASYNDLYPVISNQKGNLVLDVATFIKASKYLLSNEDPKAASDLLYLGQTNNISLLLNNEEKKVYGKLHDHYDHSEFERINEYRSELFRTYQDIVNGIGQSFSGTGIEIVLHDVRNPLKSIIAIQNPISGRQLEDPNTNFGLELIKDHSIFPHRGSGYISYELLLEDGQIIKSSTIPLYNKRYGLIGFICLNIDISILSLENPENIKYFYPISPQYRKVKKFTN